MNFQPTLMISIMKILQRYNEILSKAYDACPKIGQERQKVKIIAVSKNQPEESLLEAYRNGIKIFGENRVQELLPKKKAMPKDVEWHFIGTLQRNKVKLLVGEVFLIHSIDSTSLACLVSETALKMGIIQNVLLQVNISKESSKHGFTIEQLGKDINRLNELKGIKIKGLMTIAPYTTEPEQTRRIFRELKKTAIELNELDLCGIEMKELSMGMSGDFPVAVEEGATMIRIGSLIFGERQYK